MCLHLFTLLIDIALIPIWIYGRNDIATHMNAQKVVLYLITKNMLSYGLSLVCKLYSLSKFYDENQL